MPMQRIVMAKLKNTAGHNVLQPIFDPMGVIMKSLAIADVRSSLGVPEMSDTNLIGEPMMSRHALTTPLYGQSKFDLPNVKVLFPHRSNAHH